MRLMVVAPLCTLLVGFISDVASTPQSVAIIPEDLCSLVPYMSMAVGRYDNASLSVDAHGAEWIS